MFGLIFAANVLLTWTAPPEAVEGYRVKIGTAPGVYSQTINVGNVLQYRATTPDDVNTTFFAVVSYVLGKESPISNEVYDPKKPSAPFLSIIWE